MASPELPEGTIFLGTYVEEAGVTRFATKRFVPLELHEEKIRNLEKLLETNLSQNPDYNHLFEECRKAGVAKADELFTVLAEEKITSLTMALDEKEKELQILQDRIREKTGKGKGIEASPSISATELYESRRGGHAIPLQEAPTIREMKRMVRERSAGYSLPLCLRSPNTKDLHNSEIDEQNDEEPAKQAELMSKTRKTH